MEELKQILRWHAGEYPEMEPTDAVKLIYQNEFGGGHLISNPVAFRNYLHQEYRNTDQDPEGRPADRIGNGLVRVHLAPLKEEHLEMLAQAFLASADSHRGSLDRFCEKLELLRTLTAEGLFSFDPAALACYLDDYARRGYPMVSHSPKFRALYHPAYRIVREEFLNEITIQ